VVSKLEVVGVEVTAPKKDLARIINLALRAVPAKSVQPALQAVLLEASGQDTVRASGTDLALYIRAEGRGTVSRTGSVLVPGKLLAEVVGSLPEGEVRISGDGESVRIEAGKSVFELDGMSPDLYPAFPEVSASPALTVPADEFVEAIRQVAFACPRDDTRPHLTGVNLGVSGSEVTLAATDGGRMAVKTIGLERDPGRTLERIIPAEALTELARAVGHGRFEAVEVFLSDSHAVFSVPGLVVVTRVIAGSFPRYRQIVPTEFRQRVRVSGAELLHALRAASATALTGYRYVVLAASEGTMKVSSRTPEVGSAAVEVDAVSEGTPVTVTFKPSLLIDALEAVEGRDVEIGFTGPLSPALIRPVGDGSYMYVVAPVRVYE